jgi:hypothetical protein
MLPGSKKIQTILSCKGEGKIIGINTKKPAGRTKL